MLPETMMAVVAHGVGDYRFERVPTPRAGAGELILKVETCGICAGDTKCHAGGPRFWGGGEFSAYAEPPFVPGHEFIGHVAEIGEGYAGPFQIGDRVASEQIVPCGTCRYCRDGRYWLCEPHDVYGFKRSLWGGMAEYVRLPARSRNFAVPDMPRMDAVLIEPFACSLHAVDRARVRAGDVVVIAGAGPLGQGMLTAARAFSPRAIVSMEPIGARRTLALSQGATHAIDPFLCKKTKVGMPELVAELTDGYGCDVFIEATGHPSAVPMGLAMIAKGGRFVEFSVFTESTTTDWSLIGDAKEIDLYGSSLSPDCFERAIDGIRSGALRTRGVVTHELPLSEFARGYALSARHEGVKIALIP